MMSRIMLAIKLKSPAEMSPVLAIRTARPVIPPKVKLFVNLKKVCSECNKKRAECKHKEMF